MNKISFPESKAVCSGRDFKDQGIKDSSPFLVPVVQCWERKELKRYLTIRPLVMLQTPFSEFRLDNFLWNLHEDFGNVIYILLIVQEPRWRETIFAMVVERPVGVEEGFRLTALKNFSIVFERIFMKEEKLWHQKLKTILSQLPLHCNYVISLIQIADPTTAWRIPWSGCPVA